MTAVREIKILKKLSHENMVKLHEVVTSKGARRPFDGEEEEEEEPGGQGGVGDIFIVLE